MLKLKEDSKVYKLLIIAATLIWGASFVLMKGAVTELPLNFLLGIRFTVGAGLLAIVFAKRLRATVDRGYVLRGLLLGVLLFIGYYFQTLGITDTTPGKNAFLTAAYVVFVPFLFWFIGKNKPDRYNIAAAILLMIGVGLVSLDSEFDIRFGDWMTLLGALGFACHITAVALFTKGRDPIVLTIFQFLGTAICCWFFFFISESAPPREVWDIQLMLNILYLAVFSTCVALLFQNIAQSHMSPSTASILLSLESVFGALFSIIMGTEILSFRLILGFCVIFFAITVSETKLSFLLLEKRKDLKILRLIKGHGTAYLLVLVLMLAQASCDLLLPNFTSKLVDVGIMQKGIELPADTPSDEYQQRLQAAQDSYTAAGGDLDALQMSYLIKNACIMLGLCLFMALIAIAVNYIGSRVPGIIGRDLRQRIFSKVIAFSDEQMNRFGTASLITRATNDVQQISMFASMSMRIMIYAPIVGIGGIIMVARCNVSLAWVIALAAGLIFIFMLCIFKITLPKFKIMQSLMDKVNAVSREMINGVQVIRAFNRESSEEERFDSANRELMDTQLFTARAMAFMGPIMAIIMNASSVCIVWAAASQIDAGAMQVGDMIAFITYSMIVISSFMMMNIVLVFFPRANVSAERICEVLDEDDAYVEGDNPFSPEEIQAAFAAEGARIRFEHVSFRYPDGAADALEDISFESVPGEITGIIGSTGSGKSSILKLIMGFQRPQSGSIQIAGLDISRMRLHELRQRIAYVPQKSILFSGSIESNLKYASEDLSDEDMQAACRSAQALDFIQEMEDGFSSPISRAGGNVSGGQRQRLAIARALAKKADILLLDDSFSALDFRTDAALRKSLRSDYPQLSIIIVAQRIATVMNAARIIVIDEGRILGVGTHEELMSNCPAYREIALLQLSDSALEGVENHG